MRSFLVVAPLVLSSCTTVPADLPAVMRVSGNSEEIQAFLDARPTDATPSVQVLSVERLSRDTLTLRYGVSEQAPRRDLGKIVRLAQKHGAAVEFEKAE